MPNSSLGHVSMICMTGICLACEGQSEPTRFDQCIVGEQCVVEGELVAASGSGRIGDDEEECLAVALPEYVTDDWDSRYVRASGEIYRAPELGGLVKYKIRDRWFDAESCYSGLAMYVEKIEQV